MTRKEQKARGKLGTEENGKKKKEKRRKQIKEKKERKKKWREKNKKARGKLSTEKTRKKERTVPRSSSVFISSEKWIWVHFKQKEVLWKRDFFGTKQDNWKGLVLPRSSSDAVDNSLPSSDPWIFYPTTLKAKKFNREKNKQTTHQKKRQKKEKRRINF